MNYPKLVYNTNDGLYSFVEEFKPGVAKYRDENDKYTIIFLTNFNNGTCFELFDGKITENSFSYQKEEKTINFANFEPSNIYRVNITYVTKDNNINNAEFHVEAKDKEEVEHFIVSGLPENWKQIISHSVTRVSILRIAPKSFDRDSMFIITCVEEAPPSYGEAGDLYLMDSNGVYLDKEGDIYAPIYSLDLEYLGVVNLKRFATMTNRDDSYDHLKEDRKLIEVYCHSGSSTQEFGTYGNNYYLDINSLSISEGKAMANLYRWPHSPSKLGRVYCCRFHSISKN